ncbi:MAG: ATP-binding cassette domain-containing protein [Thermomicrobiales bacterium]|nr:ATP-binding cassette domain-containing protein [Thermomicrobiales bacterium]
MAFRGQNITHLNTAELREWRGHAQMVFQNPTQSLNLHLTVRQMLGEPPASYRRASDSGPDAGLGESMDMVNIHRRLLGRRPPHRFGGQQQRAGIARAIASRPKSTFLNEPAALLDMSVRTQIIDLPRNLYVELGITCLITRRDLSMMRHLCNRSTVMYLGWIVGEGPVERIFTAPKHLNAEALLSAVSISNSTVRRTPRSGSRRIQIQSIPGDPRARRSADVETPCRIGHEPLFAAGVGGHHIARHLYRPDRSGLPRCVIGAVRRICCGVRQSVSGRRY